MGQVLLLSLAIMVFVGLSPAYGHEIVCVTTPCEHTHEKDLSIGERIRFVIQDSLEKVIPQLRQQFGQYEKEAILNELKSGVSVAQERIDRVEDRLGIESIRDLANVNEINRIYEEFLEIESLTNKEEQRTRANALDSKVNQMTIVKQGCERPISTMDILNAENYYEKLRTDFCSKTLKNIDVKQARGYLGI